MLIKNLAFPAPGAVGKKSAKSKAWVTGALFLAIAIPVATTEAHAVSMAVKIACYQDYMSYCSRHRVGTRQLRKCMRKAGPKLSNRCVRALIAAGETGKRRRTRSAAR